MDKPQTCEVRDYSSRTCNLGTKGCVRNHWRSELSDRIIQLESALAEKEKENAELRRALGNLRATQAEGGVPK